MAFALLLLVIVLMAVVLGFVVVFRASRIDRLDAETLKAIEQVALNHKVVDVDSLLAEQILKVIYKNRQIGK
jgi:uncharacterized protein (UPF0333 family)